MKASIFILLVLAGNFLVGQKINDVSGTWIGSTTSLGITTKLKIEIEQEGTKLSGLLYNETMNEKDSAKKVISGVIKGAEIELEETDFIYRSGLFCLSNIELSISGSDNDQMLEGKWKGDLSFKTCAPGTSGRIVLIRQAQYVVITESSPPPSTSNVSSTHFAQKTTATSNKKEIDELGQGLINELRKREYYALIIGVNDYPDVEIPSLDNPISDGQKLYDVLTKRYAFKQENVTFLKNASRASIIDALDELTDKVTEKDNLLIFYAGHGIWDEQLNQGYWLPSDASQSSKSFWLSNSTLRDYLGGIPSKHTLLISDACFSGGILKERALNSSSKAILELYKLPSRKAMTSGTMTTVPDQSVFIQYLVKNLDQNESPLLSTEQLFRTFKIAVIHNSPNGQVPQYGAISQAGDEGGDFIFLLQE